MNKGIYKITNLKNNKVYIGQSEKLNNREWCHFYWLDRGEHHNPVIGFPVIIQPKTIVSMVPTILQVIVLAKCLFRLTVLIQILHYVFL